jgi:excisionase family DNA binding protein
MEKLLTVEQLADQLQVPVATIYKWRSTGGGPPAVRVGRYLRYSEKGIEGWLDEQLCRPS